VVEGSPEDVAGHQGSHTGRVLRRILESEGRPNRLEKRIASG
jgi:hypothetical protein